MPQYRTVAAFIESANPTKAELDLIAKCKAGEPCTLVDGKRPETFTESRHIRADLLRLLITGGSTECGLPDDGVILKGAWITGKLNLRFAEARGRTILDACHFTDQPALTQARLQQLSLEGSHLPGLFAQGIVVKGDVFLRNLRAMGMVDVNGAQVGGQLACDGAVLDGKGDPALNAQDVTTGASLFLRNLRATGMVDVNGAQVDGQLNCDGAKLNGTGRFALSLQGASIGQDLFLTNLRAIGIVNVAGAIIQGQMAFNGAEFSCNPEKQNGNEWAIRGQALRVAQEFFWRSVTVVEGRVDLSAARVGDLVDDLVCWPKEIDHLVLIGFTYDRISSTSPTDATRRLRWLENGAVFNGTLSPQPYTQLAKVLSDMGHERDARKVLLERETLLSRDQWAKDQTRYQALRNGGPVVQGDMGWQWLSMWSSKLWSSLIRRTAGYGYAPERALYWTLGFLGLGWLVYFIAWQLGAMVPNSAIILTSADWANAMKINPITPAHDWAKFPTAAHYETFYALPYAADVFVPLVDLGQQSAWSQTTVTWSGWATRLFTWALQVVGWVITALGAAAVTGIIKRDRG